MSGIVKNIEFPNGVICGYWVLSQFNINLEARNIQTICKAYLDKQSYLDGRDPVEIKNITIDTGYYDLAIQSMAENNFNPEQMYYSVLNSIEMFQGVVEIV